MGGLVGGIYAAGKLEVYAGWVSTLERMQVLRLLDPAFGRSGLFKGERLMGVLRRLIGDFDIEDLPISFTAGGTPPPGRGGGGVGKGRAVRPNPGSAAAPPGFLARP